MDQGGYPDKSYGSGIPFSRQRSRWSLKETPGSASFTDEGHREGSDPLTLTDGAHPLGSGGLHRHSFGGEAKGLGNVSAHLRDVWGEFRALCYHGRVELHREIPRFRKEPSHLPKQQKG